MFVAEVSRITRIFDLGSATDDDVQEALADARVPLGKATEFVKALRDAQLIVANES